MGTRDPRVDAYIAKAAEFARPILTHVRELVHRGCPEVEETIKWSMPFFVYHRRSLCHLAAFQRHAALGFWMSKLVVGKEADEGAMGQFGRLGSLGDLPADDVLLAFVRKAMELNEEGVKAPWRKRPKRATPRPLTLPAELSRALAGNARAKARYEAMPPSHRREYADWIGAAKRPETRQRRLEKVLAKLLEDKSETRRSRAAQF